MLVVSSALSDLRTVDGHSAEPAPGMIIFFDWNDENGQDREPDHTRIVEKVENSILARFLFPARGDFVIYFSIKRDSAPTTTGHIHRQDIFLFFRFERILPIIGRILYGPCQGELQHSFAFYQSRGLYSLSLLPAWGQSGQK